MVFKMKYKGGNLLMDNFLFIILNICFLTILTLFLFSKANSLAPSEEIYAKQIALALDYAKPGMMIEINLTEITPYLNKEFSKEELQQTITIVNNQVHVKFIRESKGYTYSYFNDITIESSFWSSEKEGIYVILTGGYNE